MPKLHNILTRTGGTETITEEELIRRVGEDAFRASRIPPIPASEMTPADRAFQARMQDPFDED